MTIRNKSELLKSLKPLAEKDGAYDMQMKSKEALTQVFHRNSSRLALSEDKINRLIGHQGINAEYGNGVGFLFLSYIKTEFDKSGDQKNEAKMLKGITRFCHFFFEHHSQLSISPLADKKANEHKETAGKALERCSREIKSWVDTNIEKLSAKDAAMIYEALDHFTKANHQMAKFAADAKEFLERGGPLLQPTLRQH